MSTMSAAPSATRAATRPSPYADIIRWLATPEGEAWSRDRIDQRLVCHDFGSGIFGDLIPADARWNGPARWRPGIGWTWL